MKRLEFLERARALASNQCSDSSSLTVKEFNEIKKSVVLEESSEEVELYKLALQILTDASYDMDSNFREVSRAHAEEE
jgi:hypothetical protein